MLATFTVLASLLLLVDADFSPKSYPKSFAKCPSINRQEGQPTTLDIAYVDINPAAEHTLLFVHGWPGLWSTWSNQILAFQDKYHLIVPDLRGFGESTHPGDVQSSGTMGDLVGDLACVLEHASVSNAVCIGHDWGSQLCFEAARMRPDLFKAVVGAVVPYIAPAGPFMTAEDLAKQLPTLSYQVYFEKQTEEAIMELNRDIRRTLRSVYRSVSSPPPQGFLRSTTDFLGVYEGVIPPSPFFSPEEEDYMVEQFFSQGFDNTLHFYTLESRRLAHEFGKAQGNFSLPQPVLAIYPTDDPVADWTAVAKLLHSAVFLPKLTTKTVPGHHWPQLEQAKAFNDLIQEWLDGFLPPSGGANKLPGEL